MSLIVFFLVTLGAFAVVHFVWIPSAERRLKMDRTMAIIQRAAVLSVLGLARSVFLVAALTTAALIIVMLVVQASSGATASEVGSTIEGVHRWRNLLLGVGPIWGSVAVALLILALGIYARRVGKLKMDKIFAEIYARRLEKLKNDYESGKLKEMPPTSEMNAVSSKLHEMNLIIDSLNHADSSLDAQTMAFKTELNEQINVLRQYYFALDVQRRIDLEIDPDAVVLPEARTKWEKIQTFFMSRGLLMNLNRTSRVVFLAGLLLLVPSLVSVYSVATAATLDNRLVQLQDLRVDLSRKELESEKAGLGEPQNELSEADKQTLEEVARDYEEELFAVRIPASMRASVYTMRSSLVRQAVITRAARKANTVKQQAGSVWQQPDSGSKASGLAAEEREIVRPIEEAALTRKPVTPEGRRVYTELENIAKRSPSMMERLRTELHNFQKPASGGQLTHALFGQMSGVLAGEVPGEFGNLLSGIKPETGKNSVGFTKAQSNDFLLQLIRGASFEDSLRGVTVENPKSGFAGMTERVVFHETMRTVFEKIQVAGINEKIADYPPSVEIAPEKHVDMKRAGDEITRLKTNVEATGGSSSPRPGAYDYLTDSIAGFSDWFPAQLGSDTNTKRGEILAMWNGEKPPPTTRGTTGLPDPPTTDPNSGGGGGGSGGGGGGSSSPPTKPSSASRASFSRARSFGGLRGFSRVGGVLIGQSPTNAETAKLKFTDLRWQASGSNIVFVLVNSDGQEIRSRPYRMSMAYHALNYAADGRPLAVTMASAKPLNELKILLHPTLVDNALGYRIIELDRFVDQYTGKSRERNEAVQRFAAHNALYNFVWANRLLGFFSAFDGQPGENQIFLENMVAVPELRKLAAQALKEPKSVNDPAKSPLTVKKEFYDPTIVAQLVNLSPQTTLESLALSVQSRAQSRVRPLKYAGETEVEALFNEWSIEPPKFEIWSGVRERDFAAEPASILVTETAETPMPFNFMLQVAFTSPPAFGSQTDAENYVDAQPWDFPSLGETIQKTVLSEIEKDKTGRARTILADASEFAVLQRWFRMAFNNQLGEDFPVEKLVVLSETLEEGASHKVTRTLRWNAHAANYPSALLNRLGSHGKNVVEIRNALGVAKDGEQSIRERSAPLPTLD